MALPIRYLCGIAIDNLYIGGCGMELDKGLVSGSMALLVLSQLEIMFADRAVG